MAQNNQNKQTTTSVKETQSQKLLSECKDQALTKGDTQDMTSDSNENSKSMKEMKSNNSNLPAESKSSGDTTQMQTKQSNKSSDAVINVEGGDRDEDEDFELFDDFMQIRSSQDLYAMVADLTSKDSDWQTSDSPDAVAIRQQVALAMQFQQQQQFMNEQLKDNLDPRLHSAFEGPEGQKLTEQEIEMLQKRQIIMAAEAAMREQEAQLDYQAYAHDMKGMMDMEEVEPEMLHAMMMQHAALQQQQMMQEDPSKPNHPWMAKDDAQRMYNENQMLLMHAKAQQQAQMMGQVPPQSYIRAQYPNQEFPDQSEHAQNLLLGQPGVASAEHLSAMQKAVLAGEGIPTGMLNPNDPVLEAAAALDNLKMDTTGVQLAQSLPNHFIGTWIEWFCSLEGHEFICHIPKTFLKDQFNWIDLRNNLKLSNQRYGDAKMLVLAQKAPLQADLENQGFLALNSEASDLYGLLHRRYINSSEGLAIVYGKYLRREYGTCPRALCDNQSVLPTGMNDKLRVSRVKVFCPKCEEIYVPQTNSQRSAALDGAYFGTNVSHVFLQVYSDLIVLPPVTYMYEPQIFGFKLAGKIGSKLYEPQSQVIADTDERETLLQEKISGKRDFRKTSRDAVRLKPQWTGLKTAKANVNKNNNNNNTKPQTAVTDQSQQLQQQRKHKKNRC